MRTDWKEGLKTTTFLARAFLAIAIVCIAALTAALALGFYLWEYCTVFALMALTFAIVLFFKMRKKLVTAKAIVDSAVICIQPAVVFGRTEEEKDEEGLRENFGIYVSCFGILLGTKIIRFNQDGIWLKSVEIGQDYISFGYGARGEELHNIRLLYSKPGEDVLARIIENFRKETGVIPTVTG